MAKSHPTSRARWQEAILNAYPNIGVPGRRTPGNFNAGPGEICIRRGDEVAIAERTYERVGGSLESIIGDEIGLVSMLVGPDEEAFDELARAEREVFPELRDLPAGNYGFWVIADKGRPIHAVRLSFPSLANGLFGPNLAHELVRSGQITGGDLAKDCADQGFELSQCVSVESSFRFEAAADGPGALYSYISIAQFCLETNRTGVLAHQNPAAIRSLERSGAVTRPITTTHEAWTPSLSNPTEPDPDYRPVNIPIPGKNSERLVELHELIPKFIPHYIDVRDQAS